LTKAEKELKVMTMLTEHGVSKIDIELVISEIWNEQDLDEILSLPPEKVAEIAQDIKELAN